MLSRRFFTLACVFSLSISSAANAIDLRDTAFERAGYKYDVDPVLLYSVALAESARSSDEFIGKIAPWPWTLRTTTAFYENSKEDAQRKLMSIIKGTGDKTSVDVGLMQVNLKWHSHRVEDVSSLLNIETNLDIGAQILSETIRSAPNDYTLGVGRYHHWKDQERARKYGSRVLSIYRKIMDFEERNGE